MDNSANRARDKKFATLADIRCARQIFNRVVVDGDNIFPTVRDEICNVHFARDDARNDFPSAVLRESLEIIFGRHGKHIDNLSAGVLLRSTPADRK